MNTPETFWARVEKTDTCWLWLGYCDQEGYGRLSYQNKDTSSHRVAYEITHGVIPPGAVVRHQCDNPRCCRPDHLLLGTQQDNVDDAVKRGRWGNSKLTWDEVREIREKHATGTTSTRKLAKEYNVSRGAIMAILSGRTWCDKVV